MALDELLDALACAEIEFARFNAQRTSASSGAGILLGASEHLRWLEDRSRPGSSYYNRALSRRVGHLPASSLSELPGTVKAIELRPSELQPALTDALLEKGFRPAGTLCYLAMLPPPVRLEQQHPVRRLEQAQTRLFFDLLERAGTPFPPERRMAKQGYYCTEEFQVFVATDAHETPLGWGTMFRRADYAFLGNAYTLPEARGQGVHSALLAARVNAAASSGARHILTDVEHGSRSHSNCERIGLRTATINTVWERQT